MLSDIKERALQGTMALSPMPSAASARRMLTFVAFGFAFTLVLFWQAQTPYSHPQVWLSSDSRASRHGSTAHGDRHRPQRDDAAAPRPANVFFEQAFSLATPQPHPYSGLAAACSSTTTADEEWHDDIYLRCTGIAMGLTTIVSQVKVCLKMAVDARVNLVLPDMTRRDEVDLSEYHMATNGSGSGSGSGSGAAAGPLGWDEWFEAAHLREGLGRACPRMRVVLPSELEEELEEEGEFSVAREVAMGFEALPAYYKYRSYFWVGRPFRAFFDAQLANLTALPSTSMSTSTSLVKQDKKDGTPSASSSQSPTPSHPQASGPKKPITIVSIEPELLLFRITADPTQRELAAWNDLGHLVRFRAEERRLTDWVLSQLALDAQRRPFYGVHFRVESDTIWAGFEQQLVANLDALDRAWALESERALALQASETAQAAKEKGRKGRTERKHKPEGKKTKPLVYLACGDRAQAERFVDAAAGRGWEVTHKWRLATAAAYEDGSTGAATQIAHRLDALPFDMQGAVDLGVMLKSAFFFGITGSAFSTTVANQRDRTGRYRGSSLVLGLGGGADGEGGGDGDGDGDGGARSHLMNDLDAMMFQCCF